MDVVPELKITDRGIPMIKKDLFYGWYIVGACFLFCLLFAGAGFYSFSIFIKPIEAEFGWSRSAISLTMSIYLLTAGLIGPVAGKFVQKYGPKRVMMVGAFAAGVCFMAVSQTRSLTYFYCSYTLLAIAVSGIGIVPLSSLLSNWFDDKRGTAIGLSMVGISFGGMVLSPIIGAVTAVWGWKVSFLGVGLMVWIVALPLLIWVVKDTPAEMGLNPDGRAGDGNPQCHSGVGDYQFKGWPAPLVFRTGAFWCISLSFFLAPFAQMGLLQHQVPMIMNSGISDAMASAALGVTAGVGGLGKLSFGRLSESMRFKNVVLLCFGLQALSIVVLLHADSPAMVWLYAVMFGFSMGGIVVLMPLVVGHYWGLHSYGVLLGAIWLGNAAGGSAGTYVSGLIYDYLGSYHYAMYLFLASYILAITVFFSAGSPKKMEGQAISIQEVGS